MADHIQKGKRGEEEAASFLLAKGYQILERNWRYRHKEIDIIAKDSKETVFVEVKFRQSLIQQRYDEHVNPAKQKSLLAVANAYIFEKNLHGPVRFDIIFVIGKMEKTRIEHIRDAFDSWG